MMYACIHIGVIKSRVAEKEEKKKKRYTARIDMPAAITISKKLKNSNNYIIGLNPCVRQKCVYFFFHTHTHTVHSHSFAGRVTYQFRARVRNRVLKSISSVDPPRPPPSIYSYMTYCIYIY